MFKFKNLKFIAICSIFPLALASCGSKSKNEQAPLDQVGVAEKSYYYTANEGGSISRVNASTNKVLDTIKVDGSAHNVQISPDDKTVGVTITPKMSGKDNSMDMKDSTMAGYASFYDVETNKLITKVNVGKHPAHIVFTPNGKYALVTNSGDNNVSVIDAGNHSVVNKISTGKTPHGFRISMDSKLAYVANMGEDTVSVLDIESFKEIKKIKVGKTPITTAVTKDNKTLLVTLNGENALAVVDLSTDSIEKIPVGVGPAQVYIEPDNKFAFVANQGTEAAPSNTVSKIDLSTKKVVATIETGKGAHGIVASDNNKFVYVTNMFDNTVSVIDNTTNKAIQTVAVDKTPNGISYK